MGDSRVVSLGTVAWKIIIYQPILDVISLRGLCLSARSRSGWVCVEVAVLSTDLWQETPLKQIRPKLIFLEITCNHQFPFYNNYSGFIFFYFCSYHFPSSFKMYTYID